MILNNKGFAITGILYTLFILFLLLLVSVLGTLSSQKRIIEASTKDLENSYVGKEDTTGQYKNIFINEKRVPVTGLYEFKLRGEASGDDHTCFAYLNKGTPYSNLKEDITFNTEDCNTYKASYTPELIKVISFEEE